MPNWCHNIATFSHNDTSLMEKLVNAVNLNQLLSEFIPFPENDSELLQDWCTKNWGTKWELEDIKLTKNSDPYSITIEFYSAWSPPLGFYQVMRKKGYNIKAVYKEDGLMFVGQIIDDVHDYFEYTFETYMNLPPYILSFYENEIRENMKLHFCADDLQ